MLHSCDAGEYSIITTYAPGYDLIDKVDGYSDMKFRVLSTTAIYIKWIEKSKFLASNVEYVERNKDKLTRPF